MSKHDFLTLLHGQGKRRGFRPLSGVPKRGASSLGFKTVSDVCHFKTYCKRQNVRLEIRFGFGRAEDVEVNKTPYYRFKNYASDNEAINLKWMGHGPKRQNYIVCCGNRDVDFTSSEAIDTAIGWLIRRMDELTPVLGQCFQQGEK